jgi:hypothetical protein
LSTNWESGGELALVEDAGDEDAVSIGLVEDDVQAVLEAADARKDSATGAAEAR